MTLYVVEIEGERLEVEIGPEGVRLDGRPVQADLVGDADRGPRHLRLDGRSIPLSARRGDAPGAWEIEIGGRPRSVSALEPSRRRLMERAASVAGPAGGAFRLAAPMPGLIVDVEVGRGDPVRKGQGLVIMEAMKMENELRSEIDGVVETVHVSPRQTVERGDLLIVVAPAPADSP